MGTSLFYSQRVELLLKGLIMLFRKQVNHSFVNELSPSDLYNSSDKGKRFRKQTLGALKNILKDIELLNIDRLEKYVTERNHIVHSLWENDISENFKNGEFELTIKRCEEFIYESEILENSLKGTLYKLGKTMKNLNSTLDSEFLEKWAEFEKHSDEY